jgi:hypothetical protein
MIGDEHDDAGWGRPLAVIALALLVWRVWRLGTCRPACSRCSRSSRAFWFLTAIQRAGIGPAESSRYVYVAAVFVVALIVELLGGIVISRRAGSSSPRPRC